MGQATFRKDLIHSYLEIRASYTNINYHDQISEKPVQALRVNLMNMGSL